MNIVTQLIASSAFKSTEICKCPDKKRKKQNVRFHGFSFWMLGIVLFFLVVFIFSSFFLFLLIYFTWLGILKLC